jgi:hypothetical protein
MSAVERIVAAAMKKGEAIFAVEKPGRHGSIFKALNDIGMELNEDDQGFLTSFGRFVDRRSGCTIARAAGQILKKTGPADVLFSEDMW